MTECFRTARRSKSEKRDEQFHMQKLAKLQETGRRWRRRSRQGEGVQGKIAGRRRSRQGEGLQDKISGDGQTVTKAFKARRRPSRQNFRRRAGDGEGLQGRIAGDAQAVAKAFKRECIVWWW
uniref:Uncharacterized protein n=1 Tax=Globodera rostochiensis TaxID=31243 RepID=A0A914HSZ3_GLORO